MPSYAQRLEAATDQACFIDDCQISLAGKQKFKLQATAVETIDGKARTITNTLFYCERCTAFLKKRYSQSHGVQGCEPEKVAS